MLYESKPFMLKSVMTALPCDEMVGSMHADITDPFIFFIMIVIVLIIL